ncbi:MAG: GDSL-type esterase/lipase family protein [Polyangiales bacterium]
MASPVPPPPPPARGPTPPSRGSAQVAMQRIPLMLIDDDTCYVGFAPRTEQTFAREGTPLRHRHLTDDDGFRIDRPSPPRRAACRVLAVGDSFTAGLFVDAAAAWPARLEAKLRARGYAVRVDNGGLQGHTITQERAEVLARWSALRPRIAVVGRTSNDVTDVLSLQRAGCRLGGAPPRAFAPALPEVLQDLRIVAGALEARARLRVMTERQRQILNGGGTAVDAGRCAAAAEAYLGEARDLARGASRAGIRVLFAAFEHARCGDDATRFDPARFEAQVTGAVTAEGARSLDLRGAFKGPEDRLQPWDNHPSPRGHDALAEGIAVDLVASGWLEGCR